MKRNEAAASTGRKHVISFRVRGCSSGRQSGSKQTQEERKRATTHLSGNLSQVNHRCRNRRVQVRSDVCLFPVKIDVLDLQTDGIRLA